MYSTVYQTTDVVKHKYIVSTVKFDKVLYQLHFYIIFTLMCSCYNLMAQKKNCTSKVNRPKLSRLKYKVQQILNCNVSI